MKKIIINGQMQNAARVCKLHNGVNKTPQFLLFPMAKGRTKTIAHLSIAEGSSFFEAQIGAFAIAKKAFNPSSQ
jgi:hypothetical protein